MATFRRWSGTAWAEVTRRRWNGTAWHDLSGGGGDVIPGPPDGFTIKPYSQTVDAPVMSSPPTLTSSAYGDTSPLGGSRVRHEHDSASLRYLGVLPSVKTSPTPDAVGNTFLTPVKESPWAVEFTHTGTRFAFRTYLNGAGNSTRTYWVHVNGEKMTAAPVAAASASILLDFGTSATRTIRIELDDCWWAGLDVDPGATVAPTAARPTLGILGDSWVEGAGYVGGVNTTHLLNMAYLTGRILDASCYIHGWGGTGYENGNGATPQRHYGAPARLAPFLTAAPDYLLIFGTINDGGTTIGTTAAALYAQLATDLPDTKLIVSGPESYNNATNAGVGGTTVDAQLASACAAAPNVLAYVSPRQELWITGTGNTTSPAGNGTADLYHNGENINHLSPAGQPFYAKKLAAAVAAAAPA